MEWRCRRQEKTGPELAELIAHPDANGTASAIVSRGVGIQLVERMVGHGNSSSSGQYEQ